MGFSDCCIAGAGEERWLKFICAHPLASVFHHPAWHEVIERTYGISARYLLKTENGVITAALPYARVKGIFGNTKLVSYPFSDSCDPLTSDGSTLIELLKNCLDEGAPNIEMRCDRFAMDGFPCSNPYLNSVVSLKGGEEKAWSAMHNDCVKRMIKKAKRKGIDVATGFDERLMREYYALHAETRKRQGSPVQPLSFFMNMLAVFKDHGLARIYLAEQQGIFTAGVIILKFKDTAFYKFGASLSGYGSTGHNQLVMWTAMKDAISEGIEYFDMGRTLVNDSDLLAYKSRWGAAPRRMSYGYYPELFKRLNDEESILKKFSEGIFRAMPVSSNILLGRLIYKYLA